jgi:hypothetical protein
MMMGRRGIRVGAGLVALATVPGVASAHEVAGSRFESPLPLVWLFVGAGITVALTALWLGVTERTRPPDEDGRRLVTLPAKVTTPLRYGLGAAFLAGVLAALRAGVTGRQVAAENVATLFVWPVWFRGLALLALLVGTVWPALSPWRALYRGLVRLEGGEIALVGSYPSWLGSWPAFVGFITLLGIVENLTVIPRSPRLTTVIVAAYALAMVLGGICYGRAWFERADPLGVLYGLFGRVASLTLGRNETGDYTVRARTPWAGSLTPVGDTSLVVFVVAAVYTVSFDGFTNTRLFQRVLFGTRDLLGTGPGTSMALYALGLTGFVAAFAGGVWAVERLGARADRDVRGALAWFAPTVLPIAAAYEVAHNYPYVLRNLADVLALTVGDPGSVTLLGWLSLPVFWASQVILVVVGHLVAVVAAHYVAVSRYDSPAAARRGHLPLVVVMVGYTVLSLWIISQPVVSG